MSSPADTDFIDDEGSVIVEYLTFVELIVAVVKEGVVDSADFIPPDVDEKETVVGETVVEVEVDNVVAVTSFLVTVVCAKVGDTGDGS